MSIMAIQWECDCIWLVLAFIVVSATELAKSWREGNALQEEETINAKALNQKGE